MIQRQKDITRAFWSEHERLRQLYRAGKKQKAQNDYPADVRVAYVEFLDRLARRGVITERLARRATLGG